MRDLRFDLDLCAYQAEDEDAPSWFQTKERLNRWTREHNSRGRLQFIPTPIPIGEEDEDEFFLDDEYDREEDFDMEEKSDMEEEPMPLSGDTGDEAAASGEVGEMEVDKFDEVVERSEAVDGVEAVESVHEAAAAVQEDHDRRLVKPGLDFDRRLEDAILQIREAALEDRI
jgi:hypothetical protein